MIFESRPTGWRDLERKVCQIFAECGCSVRRNETVNTARGTVKADVMVEDHTRKPHQLILCECKYWNARIPKASVHAFRTVVQDTGANVGYLISDGGFQSGSYQAVEKTNLRLFTWQQFQTEMYDRWFDNMEQKLRHLSDAYRMLTNPDERDRDQNRLLDEAIEKGGDAAWNEWAQLTTRYAQFGFASSLFPAGMFRDFPFDASDPAAHEGSARKIVFSSPRAHFDTMFAAAPRAFVDTTDFLFKYTGRYGRFQWLRHVAIARPTSDGD